MSYQYPPRRQRSPRYSPYQDSPRYQSYRDTEVGYADDYRGFAGLRGAPQQRPPWDDSREQATGWTAPRSTAPRSTAPRSTALRRTSGPFFAASDDDYDDYTAPPDDDYRRPRHAAAGHARAGAQLRGVRLLAGGLAGFLAAAVALGMANLVAAFVRPQASPIIAVGGAFIDRTPPALKNFAVEKFGENDKTMLLLSMYVTIALIAIVIGILAWRRLAIGVTGIGLFGLFGAFVAITRPESHATDVIPSIAGGIAGIIAIVWLVRTATRRPAYRGRTA